MENADNPAGIGAGLSAFEVRGGGLRAVVAASSLAILATTLIYPPFFRFVDPSGNGYGRPVAVAVDARGALLVADDVGNVVWRVTARP